jgi:RPA family protein
MRQDKEVRNTMSSWVMESLYEKLEEIEKAREKARKALIILDCWIPWIFELIDQTGEEFADDVMNALEEVRKAVKQIEKWEVSER